MRLPRVGTAPTAGREAEQRCLSLLGHCSSVPHLLQIQSLLLKWGLHSNTLVLTKFASASSAVGSAPLLLPPPLHLYYDTFLLNTLIRASPPSASLSFFSLMLRLRLAPNHFTFPFLLKSCAALRHLHLVSQLHSSSLRFGFASDPYVRNTLIHTYASCDGGLASARGVFDGMPRTSAVTWSAMIAGYVRCGMSSEAVDLFRRMQVDDVEPDDVTVITVLSACTDLGALELAKWVGSYVERENVPKSLELCNALVDALAKCGDIDGALAFFGRMHERSIVSWTSVIDGLAMHGCGREAVDVFEAMRDAGVRPDDVALIGVLTACSHAKMVDEGCRYFELMTSEFNIKPKIEHYGCMVDLFCRAGLVERALDFVKSMRVKPNAVILRTLINACRVHGKLELGADITRPLIDEDPKDGSNYVLLSNIYASMARWENKSEIRNEMSKHGIWKVPGCTALELDGKIHEFVSGDKSHSSYAEIHEMAEEVGRELKRAGHVPAISEVLLDINEEDKEDALHRHSEKLAVAFALLRTAPGTPIRIVKNLRVCGDCHTAMKFISKVYKREIVMRDRSRFHHFREGLCSCKDFW